MELTRDLIDELAEGAIILEGFDDCIIGITEEFGNDNRLLYSLKKMIDKMVSDGMTEEEAIEFYCYNIKGGYFGEQNPVFLVDYLAY